MGVIEVISGSFTALPHAASARCCAVHQHVPQSPGPIQTCPATQAPAQSPPAEARGSGGLSASPRVGVGVGDERERECLRPAGGSRSRSLGVRGCCLSAADTNREAALPPLLPGCCLGAFRLRNKLWLPPSRRPAQRPRPRPEP
ncbi:hypothetical protein HJG60_010726 [Phyllostomus discolor]|uniref:Uncharacterized protein n=1 Tax=Phyllostomus discolor TaxID=89673 RepID=A0A834ASM6_9CHIR|nr:hypothetical protein HJG60_010726 [Phyllostomus discolor]